MTDKHLKILNQLHTLATDVERSSRSKIVAALVYKGKIVSYGRNQIKTHPLQKKFKKHPKAIFLHAEIDAIRNALRRYSVDDLLKMDLYIARSKNEGVKDVWGLAKPCSGCSRAIDHFELNSVYYTTNEIGKYDFY